MRFDFTRIFKKNNFGIKFPKLIEIIFNNKNNNAMEQIIITPGFYQKKDTLNSEKPEIVRIIGPKLDSLDAWLTFDKKSISSFELMENYVKVNFSSEEVPKNNKPPKSIFEGLTNIQPIETNIQPIETNIQPIETNIQPIEINIQPII